MRNLRPYQRECIDAITANLRTVNRTVAVLPTGLGKTVIAAHLVKEWEGGNILFLAHTRELIQQSAAKIADEIGIKPHIEMNIHGAEVGTLWQGDMVVVGSVQSVKSDKRLSKYKPYPFDLIIVDESHHATAASYVKVLDYFTELNPNLKVVGITATPNRADETALGLVFNDVAFTRDITWAVNEGWLVPFEQLTVTVQSLDLDSIRVKSKDGIKDFNREELEERLTEERVLHEMATPILNETANRQAIIFTAGVQHAHALADILNAHRQGCAAAVDGTTDVDVRRNIVNAFSAGDLQYVLNFGVFTEGFDAPATAAVVMGRPTKSVSLYTQMLGRGLRPLPGVVDGIPDSFDRCAAIATSPKHNCLILDFVGASRNGVVDCYDVLGGNYDVEVKQLASEAARDNGRTRVNAEDLELAKNILALRRALSHREQILVQSSYRLDAVEGGRMAGSGLSASPKRGGATDGQVSLLQKLGVPRDTAMSYSKRQAGAVIDSIGRKRCTTGQAYLLGKAGVNPEGVGMEAASKLIDELKSKGRI